MPRVWCAQQALPNLVTAWYLGQPGPVPWSLLPAAGQDAAAPETMVDPAFAAEVLAASRADSADLSVVSPTPLVLNNVVPVNGAAGGGGGKSRSSKVPSPQCPH